MRELQAPVDTDLELLWEASANSFGQLGQGLDRHRLN